MSVTLELERTSESGGGSPAVAVSGYMAKGAGEDGLPAPKLQTWGGGGSLLDTYATTARTSTPSLKQAVAIWVSDLKKSSSQNGGDDKVNRRVRRFYQRYFTGVGVGGRLRILTLTTSDEALGKNIHRDFRRLVMRLRRRWGRFEYVGVREGRGDRQHLHLVFRGEYMKQVQLSAMWQDIHSSKVVDIRAVWNSRGGAMYLAKYLAKAVSNRYWASYNWVFQGWVGWSRRVKLAVGHYPAKSLLQAMARLDKRTRLSLMDYWGVASGGVKPLTIAISK